MAAPPMLTLAANRAAAGLAQPSGRTEPENDAVVPADRRRGLLVGLGLGYVGLYALLCWLRFRSFHAQIDLSYYLRLAWGLGHGRYDLPLVQAPHVLGLHLEAVMLPLALLGRLGVPLVPLLLFVQAAAVASLAWPAWCLGRHHLGERAALPVAVAALFYPTVTVATLHDFHPVTLALAPLLGFLYELDRAFASAAPGLGRPDGRRLRRALSFAALALLCREDIALQLAMCLLAYALPARPGRSAISVFSSSGASASPGTAARSSAASATRAALAALAVLLIIYFLTYIVVVQPRYLPKFGSYGLHFASIAGGKGSPGPAIGSGRDMLVALLRHPQAVLELMLSAERVGYVVALLWPVAFLALLAPRALVGALPILAINFLSSFPRVRTIESHYTTAMVPFIFAAAVIGAGRLRAWARQRAVGPDIGRALAIGLVGLALWAHIFHGGSPLAVRSARFSWANFTDAADAAAVRAAIKKVPADASVAARPGALAHLCQRPRVISPPEYDDGQPVDVVLTADAASTTSNRIGGVPIK